MTWFVRKISRAKWGPAPGLGPSEVAADAITSDLRTTGNTLSLWVGESRPVAVEVGVLALAAGFTRLEPFDVVWIERSAFEAGILIEASPGNTPVADLVAQHADAVRLDGTRLVAFANIVAAAVHDGRVERISKARIVTALRGAIAAGRLAAEALPLAVSAALEPPAPPGSSEVG